MFIDKDQQIDFKIKAQIYLGSFSMLHQSHSQTGPRQGLGSFI